MDHCQQSCQDSEMGGYRLPHFRLRNSRLSRASSSKQHDMPFKSATTVLQFFQTTNCIVPAAICNTDMRLRIMKGSFYGPRKPMRLSTKGFMWEYPISDPQGICQEKAEQDIITELFHQLPVAKVLKTRSDAEET